MKIPKIHLATSNDCIRPAMNYVLVTLKYIYASNGHILIRLPTEEIFGISFIESFLVFEEIAKKEITDISIIKFNAHSLLRIDIRKNRQFSITKYYEILINGQDNLQYPNAESVIPSEDKLEPVSIIGVNTKFLNSLVEAMGINDSYNQCAIFKFTGETKAIIVKPRHGEIENRLGVIMSVATSI